MEPSLHATADEAPRASPELPTAITIESYLGGLWLGIGLGSGLAGIPIAFLLKDQLHLGPGTVAIFGAITSIPLCLGFLLGFLRDRWRIFGLGDRGYLLVAAPLGVIAWGILGVSRITYGGLLAGVLVATLLSQVLFTAAQALTTAVAQHRLMTGRLSVVSMIGQNAPSALAALAGGWMVKHVTNQGVYLLVAATFAAVFLLSLWRPRAVYSQVSIGIPKRELTRDAVLRLIRHRPLWPAAIIMFLWNFSPGFQTPILYYFTDHLKISAVDFGIYNALASITFVPTSLLYWAACKRWSLRPLLWWGTLFAVVQILPVLWCHTTMQVWLFGSGVGLLGGFASAAYLDLVLRACPEGLEGTGSMLAISAMQIATQTGNLFGTWLYQHGGFTPAILTTTAVYACIAPVLLFVPRHLVATREGVPTAAAD